MVPATNTTGYFCSVFKSGFIAIVGLPNAGKSTLLNAILKEDLVITNPKAQTTRHRIKGILMVKTTNLSSRTHQALLKNLHTSFKRL